MQAIINKPYSQGLIPIIIDIERTIDNHAMVRCLYYSVYSNDPFNDVGMELDEVNYPVMMLHLEAIITGIKTFNNAAEIDEMYQNIEASGEWLVELNDIWIPKSWFGSKNPVQGDVYRASPRLFSMCWSYSNDRVSITNLFTRAEMEFSRSDSMFIALSEQETAVLKEWSNKQTDEKRIVFSEKIKEGRLLKDYK